MCIASTRGSTLEFPAQSDKDHISNFCLCWVSHTHRDPAATLVIHRKFTSYIPRVCVLADETPRAVGVGMKKSVLKTFNFKNSNVSCAVQAMIVCSYCMKIYPLWSSRDPDPPRWSWHPQKNSTFWNSSGLITASPQWANDLHEFTLWAPFHSYLFPSPNQASQKPLKVICVLTQLTHTYAPTLCTHQPAIPGRM